VGAAVLGPLVLGAHVKEREILLPLLALGLARESEEEGRWFCRPVSNRIWDVLAGKGLEYLEFISDSLSWLRMCVVGGRGGDNSRSNMP